MENNSSNISQAIKTACTNINDAAERARIRFFFSRTTQKLVYQEKYNEALDYLSTTDPKLQNYPLINAEVQATGNDPETIAHSILKKHSQWILRCAEIEKIRLMGKNQICQLTDEPTIREVCYRFVNQLDYMSPDKDVEQ